VNLDAIALWQFAIVAQSPNVNGLVSGGDGRELMGRVDGVSGVPPSSCLDGVIVQRNW